MNKLPKYDLLQTLRTQLHHFDHSPDFGDAEAVAVIRQHLLLRIREAESALRHERPAKPGVRLHTEAA
jgi:hypothetical protein